MAILEATPFPVWRRYISERGTGLPEGLQDLLDLERPLGLVGRASSASGPKARELAVADLLGTADELDKRYGLAVSETFPDADHLNRLLADTDEIEQSITVDGRKFSNRYVTIDLRSTCGAILLLSTGSGHHLDENGEQPFIRRAGRFIRTYNLACLDCKRFDRGARQDWAFAPVAIALNQIGGYFGDEDGLRRMDDDAAGVMAFLKGSSAKRQAEQMPLQTRREQRNRSGTEFHNGRARYHAGPSVPPGFGTAWLQGSGPTPTERYVFLDGAGCRPDAHHVAHGLSLVTEQGALGEARQIDQVANVRWVLKHLATPGWSKTRVHDEMIVRKMSSEHLRAFHSDASAAATTREQAKQLLKSIIANLDVYESGILIRHVGGGVDPIEIKHGFPPDGPWASDVDFMRIRAAQQSTADRVARHTRLPFVGVAAVFNGERVVMLTDAHRSPAGTPSYSFALSDHYPRAKLAPTGHTNLDDAAWRESIIGALLRLSDDAVVQLADIDGVDEHSDGKLAATLAQLEDVRSRRKDSVELMESLFARVTQTDATGESLLHGAFLARTQAEYNDAHRQAEELQQTERELYAEAERIRSSRPDSAEVSDLLRLVESLRRTTDCQYRHLWKSSIKQLRFTSERFRQGGRPAGKRICWRGVLEFVDAETSSTIAIPFDGKYETRPPEHLAHPSKDRVEFALELLLDGCPFATTPRRRQPKLRTALADLLEIDRGHVMFSCDDPSVLSVLAQLVAHPGNSDDDIAESTGESPDLVARVREVYSRQPVRRWSKPGGRVETAFYAIAAANGGRVHTAQVMAAGRCARGHVYNVFGQLTERGTWSSIEKHGYELQPCTCGSYDLTPMEIDVPDREVCRACRADRSGLLWPADPYDRYAFRGGSGGGDPNSAS